MERFLSLMFDGLVSAGDERDEQRQDHVDEERDEGVQVDLAEQPHQGAAVLHFSKRHEHVVPVNQGEEALRHHGQRPELHVVRTENDPAAEAVAQIDDGYAAAEPDHVGKCCSESDDEDIVLLEEREVAYDSDPNQESGGPQ